jgi:large subunit ribosomal protein L15
MGEFDIRKPRGATRRKKLLGRGAGSGHGSTAGRGSKGQNARSGGRTRLGFEGGQMPLFRRIARRGFSNYPFKVHYTTVDVGALEKFAPGDRVNKAALVQKKIVRAKVGLIKILGNGVLSKSLIVDVDKVTDGARKIIEAAGGQVVAEKPQGGRKPAAGKAAAEKPQDGRKPAAGKAAGEKPAAGRTAGEKPAAGKAAGPKSARGKAAVDSGGQEKAAAPSKTGKGEASSGSKVRAEARPRGGKAGAEKEQALPRAEAAPETEVREAGISTPEVSEAESSGAGENSGERDS